ncbi:serine/threonine-protein kinase [Epidermidibacterium keratini]|uniref:serine/threonine-protein kinase n=1 Tax=Epidermidibacterium keratini TaxID=1891644 RepID=UPI0021F4B6CD|nr:serine/threonine-protein kinase [Epidermidibacterium keratini]
MVNEREHPGRPEDGRASARDDDVTDDATQLEDRTRLEDQDRTRYEPDGRTVRSDTQRLLAGRYRLDQLLGRGSMGAVWKAHDVVLRRSVAVKEVLLPPTQTAEENDVARERALREARAIAALSHPNVVTLFDVVEDDGRPWVVMELVPARSLAEIIKSTGPLNPVDTARIGLAVLGALDSAHEVGITHRDVKPGNILVSSDGRVKLADFGISRKVDESSLTQAGLMVGSPSYIAPEVARGKEATRAADIWGLGATLHCAVEGTPPFDNGDPVSTLTAVVGEPPRPAPHAGPLTGVIARALDKDPRTRIRTDELREQLSQVASQPQPSTPPPAAQQVGAGGAGSGGGAGSAGGRAAAVGTVGAAGIAGAAALYGAGRGGPGARGSDGAGHRGPGGRGGQGGPHQPTSAQPYGTQQRAPLRNPSIAPPYSAGTGHYSQRPGDQWRPPPPVGPQSRPTAMTGQYAGAPTRSAGSASSSQKSSSKTWWIVAGSLVALAAIVAVVLFFVIGRDNQGSDGSGGTDTSQSSSSSAPPSSSESAAPTENSSAVENGVASGAIQVAGTYYPFQFGLDNGATWEVLKADEGRTEFIISGSDSPSTDVVKVTVVAEPLTATNVDAQIQAQGGETGSPTTLTDYVPLDYKASKDKNAVRWEYTNTMKGEDRHGFLYAVLGSGNVLWKFIVGGPESEAEATAQIVDQIQTSAQV